MSTKAIACPGCGAAPKRKTSLGTWLVTIFVAGPVLWGWIATIGREPRPATPTVVRTPEQVAADALSAKQQALAREAMRAIRDSANDPSSIKFHTMYVTSKNNLCIEYRGKNAFGAMIKNSAVFPNGKPGIAGGDVAGAWNKHCVDKTATDMSWMF